MAGTARSSAEHPSGKHPWSVPLKLDDVPETGRHVELEADEAARAAVAQQAEVVAVERLSAEFDLTRQGEDGLRAAGRVSATVRQTCVVSLEPVVNEVEEWIDVTFAPPSKAADDAGDDAVAGPAAEEGPEPLVDGAVDLGALATEFLILGIDPYPRKPGVAFEPPAAPDDAATHPFAALAALKKTGEVKD